MSHPQGLEPDEVKDEDDTEHEVDYDLAKDDGSEDNQLELAKEEWNQDNLPPHANDELFKEKHNL